MGLTETIFGSPGGPKKMNMLNEDQEAVMAARAKLAGQYDTQAMKGMTGAAGALSGYNAQSAYNALPNFEQQFAQQYGNPLQSQFQNTMSNLQHSGERNSSGQKMRDMGAAQNYIQNLGQARAGMLMTERDKQMQAREAAYGRKLSAMNSSVGAYNSMLNPGNSVLGTQSSQIAQQPGSPGLIGYGTQLAGVGLLGKGMGMY